MNRNALGLIAVILAASLVIAAAGCNGTTTKKPKEDGEPRTIYTDPSYWVPDVRQAPEGEEWYIVTENVPITDTVSNAELEARDLARRKAIEHAVKYILDDNSLYRDNLDSIRRHLTMQPQNYLSDSVVQTQTYADNSQFGIRVKVHANFRAIKDKLQELNIIRRNLASRDIVILTYGPREVPADVLRWVNGKLSEVFVRGGFEVKTAEFLELNVKGGLGDGEALAKRIAELRQGAKAATKDEKRLLELTAGMRVAMLVNVTDVSTTDRKSVARTEGYLLDLPKSEVFVTDSAVGMVTGADSISLGERTAAEDAARRLAQKLLDKAKERFDVYETRGEIHKIVVSGFSKDDNFNIYRQLHAAPEYDVTRGQYNETLTLWVRSKLPVIELVDGLYKWFFEAGYTTDIPSIDNATHIINFKAKK